MPFTTDESGTAATLVGSDSTLGLADDGAVAPRPSRLWRRRDFAALWAAETISQVGSQITAIALPLIAAIVLDASPMAVGLLAAAAWLPYLLFGLVAGVWADRLRRRPLMIAADLGRAATLTIVPIAAANGALGVETLVVVALVAGSLSVVFDVAYLAYLPGLVGREHLIEANGKLEASASAAQIVGPGLAGTLIGFAGAPFAVLFDAASFVVSALCIGRIRAPEPPPVPAAERLGLRTEISDGLRAVGGSPILRALAAASMTVSLAGYMFLAIYILYMARDLGLSANAIGFVLAAGGAGALLGALLAEPARRRLGIGPAILLGMFLFGATGMLVPLAVLAPRIALPLVVASEFLQWMAIVMHDVNAVSLRQGIVPDRMLGRVNGTMKFISWGLRPAGSLLGGLLGGVLGLAGTLVVSEFGMFLAFAWYLLSPIPRLRDIPP
ncbi:MAG TPA: MFS transporter, partial [Thermomicrobiales bacterium]|nr:MFS transporter [Thermomicrobiales bacterium]